MSTKRQSKGKSNGVSRKKSKLIEEDPPELSEEEHEDDKKSSDEDGDDLTTEENESIRVKGPDHIGIILITGGTNWDLNGRKTVPKGCKSIGRNLYEPHVFVPLQNTRIRHVVSGCNSAHTIFITEEGKALSLGRNEKGQLGVKDLLRRDLPTPIEGLPDHAIVNAATGRSHTLLLTDRGAVYSCGDNKYGQCGVKSKEPMITTALKVKYNGPPIVKVGCGADFSILLDCKGTLYSFGLPEYGQLGHNTTGEYIERAGAIQYATVNQPKAILTFVEKNKNKVEILPKPEIRDFSCGTNHTVAIDDRKKAYSWGFGGYGRLGHSEPKDEMQPRLIKYFDVQRSGIKYVACGPAFSLAINEFGAVYLFGQMSSRGEANMYPKPVQDLHGWNVRSIGTCGIGMVAAADDSCISWGSGNSSGELGLGDLKKSSAKPCEMKKLDGVYVEHVTCGSSHTFLLARDQSEDDKDSIASLPEYKPIVS
ncbi:protein RCC2 homolog [Daktulosphaira vitifoliae]|uniref:protein RCC2 homolog n=1 Tax=Daktulosphaira vitifoliae TaxID=58002 RepID=UPI0021A9A17B|nr:protein RCC2 homolog [Daktulosphaira vitifoliae]XP_050526084.1 protein RCC2 homolog [Daktulosphaira vitifoliae]